MVTKNQMNALFKQAVTTFTCKKELFYQNLDLLKAVLDRTTAQDVDLPAHFMDTALWNRPGKAPVTYMGIYEDDVLTIGVFVLRPGMRLPLHDHPRMYGLIKVIAGRVKITGFSINTAATTGYANNQEEGGLSARFLGAPTTVVGEKMLDATFESTDKSCSLDPSVGNIHEIENVGPSPAAFIDILSPPYDTSLEDVGPRKCTYFRVKKQLAPSIYQLVEVGIPSWYWNDSYLYTGPQLPT